MDHAHPSRIRSLTGRIFLVGCGIERSQPRPPLLLQPFLPSGRVDCAHDKPGDAFSILDDQSELRCQQGVWSGVYVSYEPGIDVQMRCVAAREAGRQRNLIQRVEIA